MRRRFAGYNSSAGWLPRSAPAINRLTVLSAVLALWALAIFGKLISLQVMQHARYAAIARHQQEERIDIPAPRGSILDRNGQPLAISVPVASVSVNPQQIANLKVATEVLGNTLNLDQQVLYNRLDWARQSHKGFLWVKRRIDPFETDRLKAMHLDWITFHTESQRHYPKGQTAAHILGAVFKSEEGAAGVERGMDKVLRGIGGSERLVMDVKHRGLDSHMETAPRAGVPLTLTIDERMQYVAERELKAGVEAKHARSGTAIVMNPYTGEILALANYPTYDPNQPPKPGENPLARFDLGTSVPFEPGSVFKVVTLSAALETTNMRPDTLVNTGGGTLVLPGRVVHESHHGYGTITFQEVLEKSSNIGAIMIGTRVGREKMFEYAKRYGFGDKTGLPVPAESAGKLRGLDRWGTTSLASVSMGQEVSVTSVQLARLGCVMANGGMLVKPRLILKRGDKLEPAEPPVRVIKPETAITMRQMMEGVVLRGTARLHGRLEGYTSGGKTGTAQIFDSVTHHYTHNYNASFLGFAPVTNPALVVLVTVHDTSGESGQGADAAAPVFQKIMTEALRMLDVPKDIPEDLLAAKRGKDKPAKEKPGEFAGDLAIADLGGPSIMDEDPSVRQLLADQLKPEKDADEIPPADPAKLAVVPGLASRARLDEQASPAGSLVPPPLSPPVPDLRGSLPARPLPERPMVPDFRGKSMRDVVEESSARGIDVMIEGSGVARAQAPLPGSPLRQGEQIRIVFTR
ncbi:MAG: transpeptidase family protein [Acidobacteriota bacterium]|nr:transpeptidase family protein [Acidobacteriota bacterium]